MLYANYSVKMADKGEKTQNASPANLGCSRQARKIRRLGEMGSGEERGKEEEEEDGRNEKGSEGKSRDGWGRRETKDLKLANKL